MKVSQENKFTGKYFSKVFFQDRKKSIFAFSDFDINELQITDIKKFAKKHNLSHYIEDLYSLFAFCSHELNSSISHDKRGKMFIAEIKKRYKIKTILADELIEVTLKGKNESVKINSENDLIRIRESLSGLLLTPTQESLRSFTKTSFLRLKLKEIVKILLKVFANEIPVQYKTKAELYRLIYDFLLIHGKYFETGRNSSTTPEQLIKKLLQD